MKGGNVWKSGDHNYTRSDTRSFPSKQITNNTFWQGSPAWHNADNLSNNNFKFNENSGKMLEMLIPTLDTGTIPHQIWLSPLSHLYACKTICFVVHTELECNNSLKFYHTDSEFSPLYISPKTGLQVHPFVEFASRPCNSWADHGEHHSGCGKRMRKLKNK